MPSPSWSQATSGVNGSGPRIRLTCLWLVSGAGARTRRSHGLLRRNPTGSREAARAGRSGARNMRCSINSVLVAQYISRPGKKSHAKSQRGQTPGHSQPRRADIQPGQVPGEPRRATPGDAREVTGVKGSPVSNPAVPTGERPVGSTQRLPAIRMISAPAPGVSGVDRGKGLEVSAGGGTL